MPGNLQRYRLEQGGFSIEGLLQRLGNDYLLSIWGGTAHIGAVAMAQPRPSLANPDRLSATVSVFCYVGHKEDELAKKVSQQLAAELGAKVVVAAGLHWDDLGGDDIEQVVANVMKLAEMILEDLKAGTHHG